MCKDQPRDPVTGQFLKGIGGNPATQINKDNAAEMARRAHTQRRINRMGRELVRYILARQEPDSKLLAEMESLGFATDEITSELTLHVKQILKAKKKGDTQAYTAVMRAAGYDSTDINMNVSGNEDAAPVIVFRREE